MKFSKASGNWRLGNKAGYHEHLAVANRSLFPYLSKPSASGGQLQHDRFAEIQSPSPDADQVPLRVKEINPSSACQHSTLTLACCSSASVKLHKCDMVIVPTAGPHTPIAAYRSYIQTGVAPGTNTYVEKRQSPLPQLEVDRMPPTVERSRNLEISEGFDTSRKQLEHAVEQDEARLLGSKRNDDAEAVRIDKPMPRSMALHNYKPSGGPRPMNTLGIGRGSQVHSSQPVRSKAIGGEPHQLQFETSRGNNVPSYVQIIKYPGEAPAEPPSKKQKTTHDISSPSSANSDDRMLDQIDPEKLMMRAISVDRGPSQVVLSRSISSQGSAAQKQRKTMLGGVQEHRYVENMMSSKPATKKQRKSRSFSGSHQRNHGESSSPPMFSSANLVDISGNDDEDLQIIRNTMTARPMVQTTTSISHATNDIAMTHSAGGHPVRRTNENRSKFFTEQSTSKTNGTRSQWPTQTNHQRDNGTYSNRLNDNFVRVNGDRRTSAVSGSSDVDELQSAPLTVGNNVNTKDSVPIRRSNKNSPFEDTNQYNHRTSLDEEDTEKPQSNIKAENFVAAKASTKSDVRMTKKRGEKEARWSIQLAAFSETGSLTDDSGMALVLDQKSGNYFVAKDGRFLKEKIQPDKVRRIQYGETGRKVRFMSSLSSDEEHNVLDLEFRSEREMTMLIKNTTFRSAKRVLVPGDHMDRMFEKRMSDYRRMKHSMQPASPIAHDEYCADYTEHQQESNNRPGVRVTSNIPQQRQGKKIVDELCERSRQQNRSPNEQQNLETSRTEPTRQESVGHASNFKPVRDKQLIRSTRAAAQQRKPLEEIYNDHEDLPKVVRFSKTHGLGDPWKKPLTYPLTGKKKTTVEFSDLVRLDEGEYLNDSLISFQLRFLENTMEEQRPDLAKRVYFFNTFFFATLMNTHKGKKGFNYEGVQKWTRNVDLFTYDYIVVPINDSLHWYLAIICNLPSLNRDLRSSEEIPDVPTKAAGTTGEIDMSGLVSSSPTTDIPEGDSVTLVGDQKEEPEEKAARSSFAEMSLDVQSRQATSRDTEVEQQPEANLQAEEDQEMLDGQLQRTLLQSPDRDEDQKTAEAPEADPIEDPAQPSEVPSAMKKKKRKSMPPVTKTDPSKPAIITFDSLGVNRSSTVRILKDYLREEAKAKRGGMEFDLGQIKGITASDIPMQENWYDCGLFLLGYVAKLLENDPKDFITKVIRRQYDVHDDWPQLKPSLARKSLRDQLMALHREQEAERRKERSALKNGKPDAKQSPKTRSPSRAVSPANNVQQDAKEDGKAVHDAPKSPKAPSSPLGAATRDDALKSAQPLPSSFDFSSAVHQILHGGGDGVADEQQSKPHSPDRGVYEQDKRRRMSEHENSLIIIESQSQPDEVPRSFHQSHPSQVAHRSPENSPELPAEIPDSQPSEIRKVIVETHHKPSDAIEPPQTKKRDIQEARAVSVEVRREPKRRKIEHDDATESRHFPRRDTQRQSAVEGQDPAVKTHKLARGKIDRTAGNTDEVINIDD